MTEIERYKRQRSIFQICGFILSILILIYVVITVCVSSTFNVSCIVAVSVFGGYVIVMLVCLTVFDRRRNILVEKYFGKVSVEDAKKGKELLAKVRCVMQGHYDFMDENPDFEFDPKTLKSALKRISKGYKVYSGATKIWSEIQTEIEKSPERDSEENKIFNAYVKALADLFERNKSEI